MYPNSTSPEIAPQNSMSTQYTQHERKKDRGKGRVDRDKSLLTVLKMSFFPFSEEYFTRTSDHVDRFLRHLQGSWKRSIRGRGPEVWALVASQEASLYSCVRTCQLSAMPRYIPCPLTVFFVQIWSHFVILVIKSINRVEKPYDQVLQHS